MALPSLQPRRLGRYRDLALILYKYGRSDLFSRAGLEEILAEDKMVQKWSLGLRPEDIVIVPVTKVFE